MDSHGILYIITCIFIASMTLVGVFTMFTKPENIERPILVGGLTLSTTLLAIILLHHATRPPLDTSVSTLVGISILSMLGFGLGALIDHLMGPRSEAFVEDSTLGADLAD